MGPLSGTRKAEIGEVRVRSNGKSYRKIAEGKWELHREGGPKDQPMRHPELRGRIDAGPPPIPKGPKQIAQAQRRVERQPGSPVSTSAKLAALKSKNAASSKELEETRARTAALKSQHADIKVGDPHRRIAELEAQIKEAKDFVKKADRGFAREDRKADKMPKRKFTPAEEALFAKAKADRAKWAEKRDATKATMVKTNLPGVSRRVGGGKHVPETPPTMVKTGIPGIERRVGGGGKREPLRSQIARSKWAKKKT